jgi:signal transduction histidine kinase
VHFVLMEEPRAQSCAVVVNVVAHAHRRGQPQLGDTTNGPLTGPTTGRGGGTISRRLVGILALPLVAVLVLLGFVTNNEVQAYSSSTNTTHAVALALSVQDLVQELQTERGLVAGLLGGNVSFRDELGPARAKVDAQRLAVDKLAADAGSVGNRVRTALHELDGLAAVRAGVAAAGSGSRQATFQFYTDRITTLNQLDFGLDSAADVPLRKGVGTLGALADLKEATAQERAFLNGVFSAGGFAGGEFLQFAGMRAAKQTALRDFDRNATPEQKAGNAYVLDTGAAREAAYFEQVALNSSDGRHLVVNPQAWWSALTTVLDGMLQMQRHVGSQIQARAETLQSGSTQRVLLLTAMALLCVAGAVLLLIVASRSITRPLALLAAEAHSVATQRLPAGVSRVQSGDGEQAPEPPEPVRVPPRSTVEVRSVAAALERVQAVAYSLATEQAMLRRSTSESLANLGRRNQNLLRRQLGFITNLEQQESDPTGLANLFELDHLATRMRRNAESLLVLVGAASPYKWTAPLPIVDVIRAAISEVEEYRRVSLRRVDEAYVHGAAATAIAHMLAELVENGLSFSPPDLDVEVQGRRIGDGYLIAITDQGIGMAPEDMAVANARLRGEGDFVAAPARYLGHFVVGRLASELNIDVQLAQSPVTGVTARVQLPANLFAPPPPAITAPENGHRRPASQVKPVAVEPVDASPIPLQREPRQVPVIEYRTTAGAAVAVDERTANGLRKRPSRGSKVDISPTQSLPVVTPAEKTEQLDTSPQQVQSRLTALRAGFHRSAQERDSRETPS